MAHTIRDKQKLLHRINRIRGQVEALASLLEEEEACSKILHLTVVCRGAMNSLMAEVLEGHIRDHVMSPDPKGTSPRALAAEEVIDVLKSYLK